MTKVYAVVMAGGRGERFWPLSTDELAKPFLPLLGQTTLVQNTVDRLRPLVPLERMMISVGEVHYQIARKQLPAIPAENFIVEPIGRDTAACIGLCALHLERRDPDCAMLAVPADHYVGDEEGYRRTLAKGMGCLEGATAVVFGVWPSRPDTGYGYILTEKPAVPADSWPVIRFVEKPDIAAAQRYVQSGRYFWNSGVFLWKNVVLLELFRDHMPDAFRRLQELRALLGRDGTQAEIRRIFSTMERISVDFGLLEKASGLRLVPVEFCWDDIGNWGALERALTADAQGNIARGPHVAVESTGCVLYSDAGVVATFGVSDLVVVQAQGRVLVCPKERAPDLKRLVTALSPGRN